MKKLSAKLTTLTASGLILLASTNAQAAWDFTRGAETPMGTSFSQSGSVTGGGAVNVGVSAWSAAAPPATFSASSMTIWGSNGIGITNDVGETSPEHGIDNIDNTDAVVLSFSSSVILNQVRLGWYSGDSDITVLRWVGDASGPTAGTSASGARNMGDMTWSGTSGLTSLGWELVGSYSDLATNATSINDTGKASSWWLISAYNSAYGGQNWSVGNDYFKLASVAGTAVPSGGPSLPEPASLALVAVALAAAAGSLRRRKPMA